MTLADEELYEFSTHAFVIKIWLEDGLRWRGHITHVPSGERKYFEELDEIEEFIIPYLETMGIRPETLEQLRSALRRKSARRKGIGAAPQGPGKAGGEEP